MYRLFGKRLLDFCAAFFGLLALALPLLALCLLIRLKLGSPIFFRQDRPGQDGRIFRMIKFRTMTDECGSDGKLLPDSVRLTRFGRFLRSSSLDEFPELINVVRGEMSLVGPRPLLIQYLERYTPEQARRHEVKPGITGWAQVNGRNAISWEDKFRLDVEYVDRVSLLLDIKILFMTVKKVFVREGISAAGHATIEEFRGSKPTGA